MHGSLSQTDCAPSGARSGSSTDSAPTAADEPVREAPSPALSPIAATRGAPRKSTRTAAPPQQPVSSGTGDGLTVAPASLIITADFYHRATSCPQLARAGPTAPGPTAGNLLPRKFGAMASHLVMKFRGRRAAGAEGKARAPYDVVVSIRQVPSPPPNPLRHPSPTALTHLRDDCLCWARTALCARAHPPSTAAAVERLRAVCVALCHPTRRVPVVPPHLFPGQARRGARRRSGTRRHSRRQDWCGRYAGPRPVPTARDFYAAGGIFLCPGVSAKPLAR